MENTEQILSADSADLYRLSLDIPIPGYDDFITPWLLRESGFGLVMGTGLYRNILIDPGPACGIPSLLRCLQSLGVRRLDYVLLTQVHIDHAGGVAELAAHYPALKVFVHDRGRPHVIEPSRLWQGSLRTLGGIAEAFGPISPLPEANLMPSGRGVDGVKVIDTPGHAPHHLAYSFKVGEKNVLFTGEAAGVYLFRDYLRPATPPQFFYELTQSSIDRLAALGGVSMACYGHYGYSPDVSRLLQAEREQLALWLRVAKEVAAERGSESGALVDSCLERLLAVDPNLSEYASLPPDVREREALYLRSNIKGFLGYLSRK